MFLLISMLWHRQAIFESKGDKLSSSAHIQNLKETYEKLLLIDKLKLEHFIGLTYKGFANTHTSTNTQAIE